MLFSYLRNLKTTGALFKTSSLVEREITRNIKYKPCVVIELGMGLGNITRRIIGKLHPEGKLIAFEVNSDFCEKVAAEIDDKRLTIVNDSASNIKKYLDEEAHYVISSLPISLIDSAEDLFKNVSEVMADDSTLSQVLLRKNGFEKIETYFERKYSNKVGCFPPYHISHFRKKSKKID